MRLIPPAKRSAGRFPSLTCLANVAGARPVLMDQPRIESIVGKLDGSIKRRRILNLSLSEILRARWGESLAGRICEPARLKKRTWHSSRLALPYQVMPGPAAPCLNRPRNAADRFFTDRQMFHALHRLAPPSRAWPCQALPGRGMLPTSFSPISRLPRLGTNVFTLAIVPELFFRPRPVVLDPDNAGITGLRSTFDKDG